jgi:CheY-like chemotaxis protein
VRRIVLVVEDDPEVRDTMQMVLEGAGHSVLTAPDGSAALEVLRARGDEVGLILLDVIMPIMDGWRFLEERSKSEALKRVPTVVLSAANPSNPMRAQATAFLSKPVGIDNLLRTVGRHVGSGPGRAAGGQSRD